jgi:hypothetical protein
LNKAAALWRSGIGISELGEILGHCQLPVHGDAITCFPGSRAQEEAARRKKDEQKGAVKRPFAPSSVKDAAERASGREYAKHEGAGQHLTTLPVLPG